jgi:hypothetical protein
MTPSKAMHMNRQLRFGFNAPSLWDTGFVASTRLRRSVILLRSRSALAARITVIE